MTRIEEMYGSIGMIPDVFFPESPKHEWDTHRSVVVPDFLDEETEICNVAVQTWVLRSEGRTILIDTGVGNHKEHPYVPMHFVEVGADVTTPADRRERAGPTPSASRSSEEIVTLMVSSIAFKART